MALMWRRRWVGLARWGGAVRCRAVGGRWGRGGEEGGHSIQSAHCTTSSLGCSTGSSRFQLGSAKDDNIIRINTKYNIKTYKTKYFFSSRYCLSNPRGSHFRPAKHLSWGLWGRTFGLRPVRHRVSGVGAIASLFPVPSSSPNLPTRRFPRFEMSLRLSCGLKALSRLTNWEAAASRRAQMRPTPDACRDLSELLGHPQRCAPSPYFS